MDWHEKVAAAWFGPKGFASVVYGILILRSGGEGAGHVFHLMAIVIAASMVAHSSTDVVVARWFRGREEREGKGAGEADLASERPAGGEAGGEPEPAEPVA